MPRANLQIRLAAHPEGMPQKTDFRQGLQQVPTPQQGQVLMRTNYLSVDPYMRGLISRWGSYGERVDPGDLMPGHTVGTVVESHHPDYAQGDCAAGYWGWQQYSACDGQDLRPVDPGRAPISTAIGVLGMPGMTAYFGLLHVGRPHPGETVFVTGAAGAVGSAVGQIARIKGCRTAGCAGSPEKVDYLLNELGYDAAFNYKTQSRYRRAIRRVCPEGLDVYYDNVGGPITDAAWQCLNTGARIVVCGQISQYNSTSQEQGPRKLWHLIVKQARAEGFLVNQFEESFPSARHQMARWLDEGVLTHRETVTDGLENAPKAFIDLFTGQNIGKQIVRVSPE